MCRLSLLREIRIFTSLKFLWLDIVSSVFSCNAAVNITESFLCSVTEHRKTSVH